MASEHGAINLSQGYPDFDGPAELRERVAWHMAHGHNQYAPLAGVPSLLEQIAGKVHDLYGRKVDPSTEVAVTPGATEAIYCAVTAAVGRGDEVILFDPAYDTYEPGVRLNGGVARRIPLHYPDYRVDWQRVRETVNGRTRMIMLNSPHNPSGAVWTSEDIEHLREIVAGTDILLVSDEVYEHITFDGRPHLSLSRYPDLASRAFCISSFGKTYHATGWRNLFCSLLAESRFRVLPSAGTFFQLADYSAISSQDDTEFAATLTREHKVAAIPVSVFYEQPPAQKVVRFCFAKNDDTLAEAAGRLSAV
jgi:methionine aminotransferase